MNRKYLFLPGWAVHPDYYRRLNLADGVTPEVVDYGFFTPGLAFDPRAVAAMVTAVNTATVVLAHSLGTMFALRAAARNRHLEALILFSPFPRFSEADDYPGRPLRDLRAMRMQLRRDPDGLLQNFYGAMSDPEVIGFKPGATVNPVALDDGLVCLSEYDVRESLREVKCPVLMLQGGMDGITGTGGVEYLAARLPNARLKFFPEAGHALPFTRTEECREAIRNFLNREARS